MSDMKAKKLVEVSGNSLITKKKSLQKNEEFLGWRWVSPRPFLTVSYVAPNSCAKQLFSKDCTQFTAKEAFVFDKEKKSFFAIFLLLHLFNTVKTFLSFGISFEKIDMIWKNWYDFLKRQYSTITFLDYHFFPAS